ncbi:hypothetical protein BAUCODRAFT_456068 [Baudoinia panamericana UAMH 10762]|uniref:Uncharacterized protein n=1 Tax=Baudoinia panamericana (strain UAMH 10762) TaxID=717646 RepID=M2NF14_BAUPA|nr:uncharacterized protein BAUCODRAFT_456068 [Baudoinia panamericana UAMH 10762]EMC97555.1 hypothetical protein BAUCODRAFT_456068 [Baudoinia panamericana UAMH 10762]
MGFGLEFGSLPIRTYTSQGLRHLAVVAPDGKASDTQKNLQCYENAEAKKGTLGVEAHIYSLLLVGVWFAFGGMVIGLEGKGLPGDEGKRPWLDHAASVLKRRASATST